MGCVPLCLFVFLLALSGILTCIKARSLFVHAFFHIKVLCVHSKYLIKCLYGIFFVVLDSIEYKFLGITIFIHA